jgi:hypothetical protein
MIAQWNGRTAFDFWRGTKFSLSVTMSARPGPLASSRVREGGENPTDVWRRTDEHDEANKSLFSILRTRLTSTVNSNYSHFHWYWDEGLTTLPPLSADCLRVLGALTSWSPRDLSRPVQRELYLFVILQIHIQLLSMQLRSNQKAVGLWNSSAGARFKSWSVFRIFPVSSSKRQDSSWSSIPTDSLHILSNSSFTIVMCVCVCVCVCVCTHIFMCFCVALNNGKGKTILL